MTKKIAISGYYGCDNFGDEAILSVLVKHLQTLDTEITVFSRNPEKTAKNLGVRSLRTFNLLGIIKEIARCDVLISGGGSLLQDVTSKKSLFYYLFVIKMALIFKKPVIIFAQGIGPINNKLGEWITKSLLSKCELVTVRDDKSLFLLRGWGLKPILVCDPIFGLQVNQSAPEEILGVQLRDFKTLNDNLLMNLADAICAKFANKKIEIYSFQDSLDLEICKYFDFILKSKCRNINTEIVYNMEPKDIIDRLSHVKYMIAMRFHAILVALKYGVPSLAICYDDKVSHIAMDARIPAVSMLATENYPFLLNLMTNLDRRTLLEFVNQKTFDWTIYDRILDENFVEPEPSPETDDEDNEELTSSDLEEENFSTED